MECRLCDHAVTHKHGKAPKVGQRYYCPECEQTFNERFDTLYYRRQVSVELSSFAEKQIRQVLQAQSVGIVCRRH